MCCKLFCLFLLLCFCGFFDITMGLIKSVRFFVHLGISGKKMLFPLGAISVDKAILQT